MEKKRRGRPPRAKKEEAPAVGEVLKQAEAPQKKRRGRPPKVRPAEPPEGEAPKGEALHAENAGGAGSEFRAEETAFERRADSSEPVGGERRAGGETDASRESDGGESFDDGEAGLFVHRNEGDEFAYSSGAAARGESDGEDEVPGYFSTTDDDLDPDSYRNNADSEDAAAESEGAPARHYGSREGDAPHQRFEAPSEPRQWRQNPRLQRGRLQRDPRNGQPRDNRNSGWQQGGRQPRDARQQPNQRNQQNARGRIQNGQQQRGQQPQRLQPNPQRAAGAQNAAKPKLQRGRKIQIAWVADDAMNPGNLPDWPVLKSRATIAQWLAEKFLGATGRSRFGEERQIPESANPAAGETGLPAAKADALAGEVNPAAMQTRAPSSDFESHSGAELQASEGEYSASGENALQPSESAAPSLADASKAPSEGAQSPAENGASDSSARPAPFPAEPYDPACADSFKISDSESIGSLSGFDEIYALAPREMQAKFDEIGVEYARGAGKCDLVLSYYKYARGLRRLVKLGGVLDVFGDGCGGALTYPVDSYRLRRSCVYVPQGLIDAYKLQRGHELEVLAALPEDSDATGSNCPVAVKIVSVAGGDPAAVAGLVPFTDLVPYYPTQRMIMEAPECAKWDNLSMRAVDLLTPIGRGQRALIVAPPRTGKTVLMQGMAKSIRLNSPDAHLMILLVDERPEEVTDFKRNVDAEVISSTFDEDANSHVHAAEMVISRARRMVEAGRDVVILLDSITRLARAYNALMPNGGRTMSGGVEANALQKPKRFFGSARNIEGGGSLTIIGTALVETGSKMDEVIFEEFKGTGNLELHLDRQLSDKRVFPAINMEKSGTRKEELLYHPDELKKIYALRRAMKGVPAADAMEMLIQRLKKVKTNVEFLMGLNS